MNTHNHSIALLAMLLCFASPGVVAEDKQCDKPGVPQMIQAEVVKIDVAGEKITLRDTNGTTHVLQASKETLSDYKVGDSIKAKLRCE